MTTSEPPSVATGDPGPDAPLGALVDPWAASTSAYERAKHDRTLEACGPGPFPRALELGSGSGALSFRLAGRCTSLVSIDPSESAISLARERLAGQDHVQLRAGAIPDDLPDGEGFDLVVASEILGYLPDDAFRRTVDRLPRLLRQGGRFVAVHWSGQAPDLVRSAAETHRALRVGSGLRPVDLAEPVAQRGYLLDAFDMR